MKTTKSSKFFYDKPLFGLDIGHGSLKVMQIEPLGNKSKKVMPKITGYGFTKFDGNALDNGVIVDHETIAKAVQQLFKKGLVGDITTRRVALSIPSYRTFMRFIKLPKLNSHQIKEVVKLEIEQYNSAPLGELYLDYEIVKQTDDSIDIFAVAVPHDIVDSYIELIQILGLEVVLAETTLSSTGRIFSIDKQSDVATIMIDFGSLSCDISIYDRGHILVTGTVEGGGEHFTKAIMQQLGVTEAEASIIKTRYGLGTSRKQAQIQASIEPTLNQIIEEIQHMIRNYEKRYGTDRPITQVITAGGGANIPGLNDYLTNSLRLAVRNTDPWKYLDYQGLQLPNEADQAMYTTVAGLSLASNKEVLKA